MEERQRISGGLTGKHRRLIWLLSALVLLGSVTVIAMCLTREKTKHISSEEVQAEQEEVRTDGTRVKGLQENEGAAVMETNPLNEAVDADVKRAVEEYYATLTEHADFVEGYHNLQIYTKLGKYQGTYLAFVRYDMKIRDIYTEVPGLGTLYLEKNGAGSWEVVSKTGDQEIQEFVDTIVTHEDVRALMEQIQTDYAAAVASDATLAEGLKDLKEAYENRNSQ